MEKHKRMANEHDTDTDADTREWDQRVRAAVYDALFTRGAIPLVAEIAAGSGRAPDEVRAALQRLTRDHLIVLHPESGEIMMALPFSATPTPFQVEASGHTYWGNCAWDALGILAMLKTDGRVLTRCGDCDEPMTLIIQDGAVVETPGLAHFGAPARVWWDDIIFT